MTDYLVSLQNLIFLLGPNGAVYRSTRAATTEVSSRLSVDLSARCHSICSVCAQFDGKTEERRQSKNDGHE